MTLSPPHPQDFAAELTRDLWDKIKSGTPTGVRPRIAATLILIDRAGPAPKVLMGRRNAAHRFMPGKFVFPGGRVEPCDRRMETLTDLDPVTRNKLMRCLRRPSEANARALAMAAIRETFEETGVLVGALGSGRLRRPPLGAWSDFAAQDVSPSLDAVHFIGRAVTPPRNRLRYDTFFLAADAAGIAKHVEGAIGPNSELVELAWVTIPEALDMDLVAITKVMLRELENRLAFGLDRSLPTPFYRTGRGGWTRVEV